MSARPSVTTTPDRGRVAQPDHRHSSVSSTGAGGSGRQAACPPAPSAAPGGSAAGLGTDAKSSSPAGHSVAGVDPEVTHRAVRYATRRLLWSGSSLPRVRACGKHSTEEDGAVGVKVTAGTDGGNVAGFRGVTTCGSVWSCPVCSAKVAAHRQNDLAQAVDWYTSRGQSVYMVTLTMRHHAGQRLRDTWATLSYAWNAVNSGKQWMRDKEQWGVSGFVRVTEGTHGFDNGWHIHAHVLIFFDGEIGDGAMNWIGNRMWQRWDRALRRKGYDSTPEHGLDIKKADEYVADYLNKTVYKEDPKLQAAAEAYRQAGQASARKLAGEAALGVFKEGRRGNRTPFEILHSIAAGQLIGADTSTDERLWHEWEQGSKGRQQMLWSQFAGADGLKLRDRVGLNDEKDAEEIAEDDDLKGEVVAWMPKSTWNVVKWEAEFLLQAFDHSVEAGIAYLRQRRLLVTDARGDAHLGTVP